MTTKESGEFKVTLKEALEETIEGYNMIPYAMDDEMFVAARAAAFLVAIRMIREDLKTIIQSDGISQGQRWAVSGLIDIVERREDNDDQLFRFITEYILRPENVAPLFRHRSLDLCSIVMPADWMWNVFNTRTRYGLGENSGT